MQFIDADWVEFTYHVGVIRHFWLSDIIFSFLPNKGPVTKEFVICQVMSDVAILKLLLETDNKGRTRTCWSWFTCKVAAGMVYCLLCLGLLSQQLQSVWEH